MSPTGDYPRSANVWPAFRGYGDSLFNTSKAPTNTDQSYSSGLPLSWTNDSVTWRVSLPGYGQSSPVVWYNKLFLTTMQGKNKETPTIICFDLSSGKQLWKREFKSTQEIKASKMVTRSSPTPVVDADKIYAFFESGELIALDHAGNTLWQRSLVKEYGKFKGPFGVGSSLGITPQAVIVVVNHKGPSYTLAINKKDGKNIWKKDYEARVAWSSPISYREQGKSRIVISAAGLVQAYDTKTGNELWTLGGLEGNTVPSATVTRDFILVGSKDKKHNLAIRRNQTGELDSSDIAWSQENGSCTFNSPMSHLGRVYSVSRKGIAYCTDLKTGKTIWKKRIGGSCWATHLGAENRVYFFQKHGKTTVVSATADQYTELATSQLKLNPIDIEKPIIYGYSVTSGRIVFRSGNELICIALEKNE